MAGSSFHAKLKEREKKNAQRTSGSTKRERGKSDGEGM
jgi:hypothetical protein